MNKAVALHSIENEQRVLGTDLAERLGFERPRKIRELINRKLAELQRYGTCPSVGRVIRGNLAQEYYLNEEQALLVCMFSDTDNASNVRKQVIDTFMAVRRGQLQPAVPALISAMVKSVEYRPSSLYVSHVLLSLCD